MTGSFCQSMELIGTSRSLYYIIKVCDLSILYALLPTYMGPLTEWGPGQNIPVALPPVGGPGPPYKR